MKTIRVSEASGLVLDWLVAKCEKQTPSKSTGEPFLYEHRVYLQDFMPSTCWSHGGPIIYREGIATEAVRQDGKISWWEAATDEYCWDDEESEPVRFTGPTPLIAAMRCYVASKLGEEVEVPEELV